MLPAGFASRLVEALRLIGGAMREVRAAGNSSLVLVGGVALELWSSAVMCLAISTWPQSQGPSIHWSRILDPALLHLAGTQGNRQSPSWLISLLMQMPSPATQRASRDRSSA